MGLDRVAGDWQWLACGWERTGHDKHVADNGWHGWHVAGSELAMAGVWLATCW